MVGAKQVSRDAARDVLTALVQEGGEPRAIVEREGLGALSDADGGGLAEIVAAALAANPDAAAKVAAGNMKAIGPLVGYVMRETKGRADGGEVTRLIREHVAASARRVHAVAGLDPHSIEPGPTTTAWDREPGFATPASATRFSWRPATAGERRDQPPSRTAPPAPRSRTSRPVNGRVVPVLAAAVRAAVVGLTELHNWEL